MLNTSFLQNNNPEILVIKIHQRNVKIPSEEAKLTKLNCSLFLESITPLSIPESAETARIWHLALRGGSSFLCECRVAPDSESSWKCSSLELPQEPGTEQVPDVQHPAAPAGTDSGAVEPIPAREPGWPHWEEASQQFLSVAQRHHRLSQLENSVLLTDTVHQQPATKGHFSVLPQTR